MTVHSSRRAAATRAAPALLVSVRNAAEAQQALGGGCDILDVKEPARGSLGMADVEMLADILRAVNAPPREPPSVPVSAALGEVVDWVDWTDGRGVPQLPSGLRYAKLGLAGLGRRPDWRSVWQTVRRRLDGGRHEPLRWIAVVYADWQTAQAPQPEAVIEAAAETGCAGVLVDTHSKTGGPLPQRMPGRTLLALAQRVHRHGLRLAVAGGLSVKQLRGLPPADPDIVAIRTAACRNAERLAEVDGESVRRFRRALRRSFGR